MPPLVCKVTCTSEHCDRPNVLNPRNVFLPIEEVERGDITTVTNRCVNAFFAPPAPRPPHPFNLYAGADVPLTADNLAASLLGSHGLPTPPTSEGMVLLSCGPTKEVFWRNRPNPRYLPPDPHFLRSIISPGGEDNVSILYESEDIDNSFESLLRAKQRAQQRGFNIPKQEMHSYIMPLLTLGWPSAQKDYKVHYDTGVGLDGLQGLENALDYAKPKNQGCIVPVINNGSSMFFADGVYSRFGLGFKSAAYHRGSKLTVAGRGELAKDPTEIVEGTIDLETWFDRSRQGMRREEQYIWWPAKRSVMGGMTAAQTASQRGEEWEATDPCLPRIKELAEDNSTFFMAITSQLKEVAVQQMTAEGGLRCLRNLRHMYFYMTSLANRYHTPANDGYPCPAMHLHVATGRGNTGHLLHFRIDESPWEEWPEVPINLGEDQLQREDTSSRLLRFVHTHATLPRPFQLRRTGMRVQDGFCFAFTHPCLKATDQEELPICTVVLRYLPDAGFGRLKGLLDTPIDKVLDVYYKGRLVPLNTPITDVEILTRAVARLLKDGKKQQREQRAVQTIQERYCGQVFLQGAMTPDLVDHTKFRLGILLPLAKDSFKARDKSAMQYFAVDPVQGGKQTFRSVSEDDLIGDFSDFHSLFDQNFEKAYVVSEPVTFETYAVPEWFQRASRTHAFFKKLVKSSEQHTDIVEIGQDVYQDVPQGPQLHSCGQQYRTLPAKVVAFKVKKEDLDSEDATSYSGHHAQMLLQLKPEECFNDMSFREVSIMKHKPMTPDVTSTASNRRRELLRAATLRLQVQAMDGSRLPSSLQAGSRALDVVVYAKSNGENIIDWHNPAWDGTGRKQFEFLRIVQTIKGKSVDGKLLDTQDSVEDKKGFKFSISAEELKQSGPLEVSYCLVHPFLPSSPYLHKIKIEAGEVAKLHVTWSEKVRLGCPANLFIQGLDVRNNPSRLPTPEHFPETGFCFENSLVNGRQAEEMQLEVLELQRQTRASKAKLVVRLFPARDVPTLFGEGQHLADHIVLKAKLVHGPSGLVGAISAMDVIQGIPSRLDLSSAAPGTMENGSSMAQAVFKVMDACGCYVGLPQGWRAVLVVACTEGTSTLQVSADCTAEGCHLYIPDGVLLDAGTDLAEVLHLTWYVALLNEDGNQIAISSDHALLLEPCKRRPRKALLRYQGSEPLQPLGAEEVYPCLERVNAGMRAEAGYNGTVEAGTPVYKLYVANGSARSICKVEGLQLILEADAGQPCDPEAQVNVIVRPKKTRAWNSLDDEGCFTNIIANPLQGPDALYRISCSLSGQGAEVAFFLVVHTVPPTASAWQWCIAGTAAPPTGDLEVLVMQPLSLQLSWAAVDEQGAPRDAAAQALVSLSLPGRSSEPGCSKNVGLEGGIQLCRSRGADLELLGMGPVQWDDQLFLQGRSNTQFLLQLNGGSLRPAEQRGRLLAGAPSSFSVHGLPGLPGLPGAEVSLAGSEPMSLHQDLSGQLCLVLLDAAGNVATIPSSWNESRVHLRVGATHPWRATIYQMPRTVEVLPLEDAGSNILRVPVSPGALLHLFTDQALTEVELTFQLTVLPTSARGGSRGRPAHLFQVSSSVVLPVAASTQLVSQIIPQLPASLSRPIIAGTTWPDYTVLLHLKSEAGTVLNEMPLLEALAQSIQATLRGPHGASWELQCRVVHLRRHGPKVVASLPPPQGQATASGTYSIHAVYTEGRPAEAALVRGSSAARIEAPQLQFRVHSGRPENVQITTQLDLLSACNSARSTATTGLTCTTTILQQLDAQLIDGHGNHACPPPDLQSLAVELSLLHVEGHDEQQPTRSGRPGSSQHATVPSLAQARIEAHVSPEGKLTLGPVCLVEGSGRGLGTCRLCLQLSFADSQVNLQGQKLEFTFFDEETLSAERIEAAQCGARHERAQRVLSRERDRHQAAAARHAEATAAINRVWAAAHGAFNDPKAQQALTQLGMAGTASLALNARNRGNMQHLVASVLQQLEGLAAPAPKANQEWQLARSALSNFKSSSPQHAQDVLGLALDLITCEDDNARLLAAWKLGAQVIMIVRTAEVQAALCSYLSSLPSRDRPTGIVHSLDLLSSPPPLTEPRLSSQFSSQVGNLRLPAYLASLFGVRAAVPGGDRHKLLCAVIGGSILLPNLAQAQNYRRQVLAKKWPCPELLTVEGLKLGSQGEMAVGRDDARNRAPASLSHCSWHFGGPLPADVVELQGRLQEVVVQLENLPGMEREVQAAGTSSAAAQASVEKAQREAQVSHEKSQEALARLQSAGPSAGPSTSVAPAQRSSKRGADQLAEARPKKHGRQR